MDLFEVVFYPIRELFNMLFNSDLASRIGFSLPHVQLGLYAVSGIVAIVFGLGTITTVIVKNLKDGGSGGTPRAGK